MLSTQLRKQRAPSMLLLLLLDSDTAGLSCCLQFGNPHSRTHLYGWESENAVEKARQQVRVRTCSADRPGRCAGEYAVQKARRQMRVIMQSIKPGSRCEGENAMQNGRLQMTRERMQCRRQGQAAGANESAVQKGQAAGGAVHSHQQVNRVCVQTSASPASALKCRPLAW